MDSSIILEATEARLLQYFKDHSQYSAAFKRDYQIYVLAKVQADQNNDFILCTSTSTDDPIGIKSVFGLWAIFNHEASTLYQLCASELLKRDCSFGQPDNPFIAALAEIKEEVERRVSGDMGSLPKATYTYPDLMEWRWWLKCHVASSAKQLVFDGVPVDEACKFQAPVSCQTVELSVYDVVSWINAPGSFISLQADGFISGFAHTMRLQLKKKGRLRKEMDALISDTDNLIHLRAAIASAIPENAKTVRVTIYMDGKTLTFSTEPRMLLGDHESYYDSWIVSSDRGRYNDLFGDKDYRAENIMTITYGKKMLFDRQEYGREVDKR